MKSTLASRRGLVLLSGLIAGALVGTALAALAGAAVAHRNVAGTSGALLEATHLPPLLTVPGERVELRYDVYCVRPESVVAPDECDAVGSVFVRTGSSAQFIELPLRMDPDAPEGRLVARLPHEIAASPSGFFYYATFANPASGATVVLPSGGREAPQRSLPLNRAVHVEIREHVFGEVSGADARVADAAWGDGLAEIGLEQGRSLDPMGGSAFDVDRRGVVHVLDEANRRLLRWRPEARSPDQVPLSIDGTMADLSIGADGAIYVLETGNRSGGSPVLRTFSPVGTATGMIAIAERASQVRIGPTGAVVHQQPSGQWMSATLAGRPLPAATQRASGRSGRPLAGGGEVVVLRRDSEIRAAVTGLNGSTRREWRITSETPFAEVQLAEPYGKRLVLVVRVYTNDRDEFVALVLGERGLVRKVAIDPADWAETAPLSRFRLAGSSLYQLGSTPAGLFVDRFDLEVK